MRRNSDQIDPAQSIDSPEDSSMASHLRFRTPSFRLAAVLALCIIPAHADVSGELKRTDLPTKAQRPVKPASGWGLCNDLSPTCATSVEVKEQTPGVLQIVIKHKPVPNVTVEMMQWLYAHLDDVYPYTFQGKLYSHSLFLRMHPVDHLRHKAQAAVAKGTKMDWIETPLYGCTQPAMLNSTTPFRCGVNRQGLTRPTNASLKVFTSKITTKIAKFDSEGYFSVSTVENPSFDFVPPGGLTARNVSSLKHAWSNTAAGVQITTTFLLGVLEPGSDSKFQGPTGGSTGGFDVAIPQANAKIAEVFTGSAQWKNKSVKWIGYGLGLHWVQEVQYLSKWLPESYAQNAVPAKHRRLLQ